MVLASRDQYCKMRCVLGMDVISIVVILVRSNVKKVRPWNKAHGLRVYMLDYAYEVRVSSRARIDVESPSKVKWFVNVLVKYQGLVYK
ncbi:hypothetical protein Tco_1325182 [Tanacetum coccineum]